MLGCSVQRWSVSLGRWFGIPIRLHIFFLVFAGLAIAFSTLPDRDLLGDGLLTLAVVLVSVVLHEAAHAMAALRVGGKVDSIVLGPVGGLVSPRVPDEPEVQLAVAMAGPITHLMLVVVAATALAIAGYNDILGLMHPLDPSSDLVEGSPWFVLGKLMLWLNWVLLLLNLLPAYPFDGGPILRSMLWPAVGRRTARIITGRAGMVVPLLICAVAFMLKTGDLDSIVLTRLSLVMLGIFLFFSARQDLTSGGSEELFDEATGYRVSEDGVDLLDADGILEEEDDAVLVEHQRRPTESRKHDRRAEESFEDARVDDILARLHQSKLSDLSREELEVLKRASERYKQRHGVSSRN
jgi:Zn-dependent protease